MWKQEGISEKVVESNQELDFQIEIALYVYLNDHLTV